MNTPYEFSKPLTTGFLGNYYTTIYNDNLTTCSESPEPYIDPQPSDVEEEHIRTVSLFPLQWRSQKRKYFSNLVPVCSLLYSLSAHGFCNVPLNSLTQRTQHSNQTFENTPTEGYIAITYKYIAFALGMTILNAKLLVKRLQELGAIKIVGKCFFVHKTSIKFKNKVSLPVNIYQINLKKIKPILSDYYEADISIFKFRKGVLGKSFSEFGKWMHENVYLPKYAEEHGKHFDTLEELEKFYHDNEHKHEVKRTADVDTVQTTFGDPLLKKVYEVDSQTKWYADGCLRGYTPLCGTHNPENYANSKERPELLDDLFKGAHRREENYVPSISGCDVNGSIQRIQRAMGHNGNYPKDFSNDIYYSIGAKTELNLYVNSFNNSTKHTNGGVRKSFKTLISAIYMKPRSTAFFGVNCDKVKRGEITAYDDSDAVELAKHANRLLDVNPNWKKKYHIDYQNVPLFQEIKHGLTDYHGTDNFLGKFVFPIETVLMAMVTLDLRSMGITAVPLYDEIFYDKNEFRAKKPNMKFEALLYQLLAKNMKTIYDTIQRNILAAYHHAFTLGNSLTARNTDTEINYYYPESSNYAALKKLCDNKWHKGDSVNDEVCDRKYKYTLEEDGSIKETVSYTGALQRVVISNNPLANAVPCVLEYKNNLKKLHNDYYTTNQKFYAFQNEKLLSFCYRISAPDLLNLSAKEEAKFYHQLNNIPTHLTPLNYYKRVCTVVKSYETDESDKDAIDDYLKQLNPGKSEDWIVGMTKEEYNEAYNKLTEKLRADVEKAYLAIRQSSPANNTKN